MEVLKECEALLSNYEVLALLTEQDKETGKGHNPKSKEKDKDKDKDKEKYIPQNLRTIEFELKKYLNNTPVAHHSKEQVEQLLDQLKNYKLTKAEKLCIVNLRPSSQVELHVIIEDCQERFGLEDLQNIINIVTTTLPVPPSDQNNEENNPPA